MSHHGSLLLSSALPYLSSYLFLFAHGTTITGAVEMKSDFDSSSVLYSDSRAASASRFLVTASLMTIRSKSWVKPALGTCIASSRTVVKMFSGIASALKPKTCLLFLNNGPIPGWGAISFLLHPVVAGKQTCSSVELRD